MNAASIVCYDCGGYILKPRRAQYRFGSEQDTPAVERARICECSRPVLPMPRLSGNVAIHELVAHRTTS
jgi:hypothetical protein